MDDAYVSRQHGTGRADSRGLEPENYLKRGSRHYAEMRELQARRRQTHKNLISAAAVHLIVQANMNIITHAAMDDDSINGRYLTFQRDFYQIMAGVVPSSFRSALRLWLHRRTRAAIHRHTRVFTIRDLVKGLRRAARHLEAKARDGAVLGLMGDDAPRDRDHQHYRLITTDLVRRILRRRTSDISLGPRGIARLALAPSHLTSDLHVVRMRRSPGHFSSGRIHQRPRVTPSGTPHAPSASVSRDWRVR